MPRLAPSLLATALREDPLLPWLLRTTRTLPSARQELRWLREHAISVCQSPRRPPGQGWRALLRQQCSQRAKGLPLQYLVGNQPFGDLEIHCRPGVFIPRPETEAYITHLANLLHNGLHTGDEHVRKSASSIRILDLCTGTGSIPLLLHSILSTHLPETHITGVDISPKALALARYNLRWNTTYNNLSPTASQQVTFLHADVLGSSSSTPKEHPVPNIHQALKTTHQPLEWDILISNPPYISTYSFQRTTSRSVRNHEPKSALVPSSSTHPRPNDDDGDVFYPPLLSIATSVHAKLVVLEVADMEQAQRVVGLAIDSGRWHGVGIWRDWPEDQAGDRETVVVQGRQVAVAGDGNGRVVLCWSREGGEWIGRP